MTVSPSLREILHITNEDMIGALWERVSDAMAISDEQGIVIAANRAYYDLYGYSSQEVIGQSFAIIFPPHERISAEAAYRQVFALPSPPTPVEAIVQRSDGTERIVESRVEFITQQDARVAMLSIVRDITEQKRVKQSLLANEERLRLAVASADVGTWDFNPITGELTWDARCRELFGVPIDEPISYDTFLAYIHPDDRERTDAVVQYALKPESGGTYDIEYRTVSALNDRERWIAARGKTFFRNGQAVRFIGTVLDITDRKRIEAERALLLDREQRYTNRLARLQNVTSAFTAALTPEQVANVILTQGIAAIEAAGGLMVSLAPEGDSLMVVQAIGYPEQRTGKWSTFPLTAPVPLAETVRTGQRFLFATFADARRHFPLLESEEVFSGGLVTLPLRAGERTIGAVGFSFTQVKTFEEQDIEFLDNLALQCGQALERARLFESEQQARAAAQEAVGMRDVFFSIASHELKNPLTSLLGNAQLLQRRLQPGSLISSRDQRALNAIAEQARRLHTMIETMLDVSRLETGQLSIERQPLELIGLVRYAIEEIEATLTTHTLIYELSPAELWIKGDSLRLMQVFHNLIGNAAKYSPLGGTIVVRVDQDEESACINISDQGIGIPAAEIPNLFQRFYRVANTRGNTISGVGVGLYVVKEIVMLHGGTIKVTSSEGEGSTFSICLPIG